MTASFAIITVNIDVRVDIGIMTIEITYIKENDIYE